MQTEILSLLTKKNNYLLQIQQISEEMCSIDVAKLEDCMNRREKLIEQIKTIDGQIQQDPKIKSLQMVFIKARELSKQEEITDEEKEIFRLLQCCRQLAASIIEQDLFAQDRIKQEQHRLLEQIKKRNKSQTAANGYYKTVNTSAGQIFEARDLGKI